MYFNINTIDTDVTYVYYYMYYYCVELSHLQTLVECMQHG